MKYNFKGKRALVTGGARGIGFSICESLIDQGVDVILTDIDKNIGALKAKELGIEFRHLDVTNRLQFLELFKEYEC